MTTPDLDTYTPDGLRALIVAAQGKLEKLRREQVAIEDAARSDVASSVDALDTLIGDGTTSPTMDNIVGIQLYKDAQISSHAVQAIRLILRNQEQLARITRNIARIVRSSAS